MTAALRRKSRRWSKTTAYVVSSVIFALLAVQTLVVPFLYHHVVDQQRPTTSVHPFSSDAHPVSSTTIRSQELSNRRDGSYSSQQQQPGASLVNASGSQSSTSSYTNNKPSVQGSRDGAFNGYPIYYVDMQAGSSSLNATEQRPRQHSTVHCAGDNFQHDTAWIHRSCQFRRLCFDTNENEYVIFRSPQDVKLQEALAKYKDGCGAIVSSSTGIFGWFSAFFSSAAVRTSPALDESVALGGLNPKWTWDGMNRVKWFPKVVITDDFPQQYYELDPKVVWVPFHSFYAANPGKCQLVFC
jgi:hypothetical protein